jgi:trimethylamine--corrinoid protein Co-methyltransferase
VQAGATGPVTLAGLLAQQNAEILAALTLVQIPNPGNPFLYATTSGAFDMGKGMFAYATPEGALINCASAQLDRFYNLPIRGTAGVSEAHIVDAQAGLETRLRNLVLVLSGVGYLHSSAGSLESSLGVSYAKMVIDNEVNGHIRRIARGIEVSDATLALPTIREVGPRSHFLDREHTLEHHRRSSIHRRPSCESRTMCGARRRATISHASLLTSPRGFWRSITPHPFRAI